MLGGDSLILLDVMKVVLLHILSYHDSMLLHNYVQHEKCLPSVTKNYEIYYSLKMVN